ncbi:MAG: site-specific tyrosine recombinase [Bacteroidia bacterium]|nr:site-specific tyrosine recombinase [Bacteroidia bacterium]
MSSETLSWAGALSEFEQYLAIEQGAAGPTRSAYLHDAGRYARYLEQTLQVAVPAAADAGHVRLFLTHLQQVCDLQERSLARNLSAIRAFHGFLLSDGLLEHNPCERIEMPKMSRSLPLTLSVPEVEALLAAAIEPGDAAAIRNRAMLELLYSAGLRVSELANLELQRVFFQEGFVRILGKGNKERLVPAGAPALRWLERYLREVRAAQPVRRGHESYVFLNQRGGRISRVSVFTIVQETARRAGISRPVSPHTFRHTFATHLIEGGADLRAVQDMLGHESITTTEIYLHVDREYLREVHALYHPRK